MCFQSKLLHGSVIFTLCTRQVSESEAKTASLTELLESSRTGSSTVDKETDRSSAENGTDDVALLKV